MTMGNRCHRRAREGEHDEVFFFFFRRRTFSAEKPNQNVHDLRIILWIVVGTAVELYG